VWDEGDGLAADFDNTTSRRTGMRLVEHLVSHDLGGEVRYEKHALGGLRVLVMFPVPLS